MFGAVKIAALCAGAMLALSACSPDEGEAPEVDPSHFPAGSTMAKFAEAGTITVGVRFDQPLFGVLADEGIPEGFDVKIAEMVVSELGIESESITWVETVPTYREPFLEGGQVDMVVATYTITDERKEAVSFAGPYYIAGQAMMVQADNDEITAPADMAGRTVCSVEGSTSAQYVRTHHPDATLVLFGAYADCLEPLRSGDVDVVTTDNTILAGYVEASDGEFVIAGEPFTEEPYGIGLPREDTEFRIWVNDVLEAAFEDGRWLEAWNSTAGTVMSEAEPPDVDRYALAE